MGRASIRTLDDPRLDPYRALKEAGAPRRAGRFIAEGAKLVERLLASRYPVESLLVCERFADEFAAQASEPTVIYVMPDASIEQVVGFNFHRGVLACAQRPPRAGLVDVAVAEQQRLTVVVCPNVQDPENLGAILRLSAAFGVDLVVVGEHCADPFSRRVLRVSMGAVFQVPVVEARDLSQALDCLRDVWQLELWATVLGPDSQPLADQTRPPRLGLLFGSEGHGLEQRWIDRCHRRVTIPMPPSTDSLNVAVAAGIFLYELSR